MKRYLLASLFLIWLFPLSSFSQENVTPATKEERQESEPNRIKAGFYIKLGPSFPMGTYATRQNLRAASETHWAVYSPAKMGAAIDMGYLIYLGPAFANNHLRLGIDAAFISFSFNPVKASTSDSSTTKYWYYYLGQKFGPLISICPVDRLVIDLSYKMNAYVAYVHHEVRGKDNDEWGKNLTQSEISMSIRYSLILFSFQYNFGKATYNDFDSEKPKHYVDNTTFRIMVGFKF